ncbi:unnamed protein product [Lota lota]
MQLMTEVNAAQCSAPAWLAVPRPHRRLKAHAARPEEARPARGAAWALTVPSSRPPSRMVGRCLDAGGGVICRQRLHQKVHFQFKPCGLQQLGPPPRAPCTASCIKPQEYRPTTPPPFRRQCHGTTCPLTKTNQPLTRSSPAE